jgi:hypothetical protein
MWLFVKFVASMRRFRHDYIRKLLAEIGLIAPGLAEELRCDSIPRS